MRSYEAPVAVPTATGFGSVQIGAIVTPRPEMITGSQRYFFDLLRALPKVGVEARGVFVGRAPPDEVSSSADSLSDTGTSPWHRVWKSRQMLQRLVGDADVVASHFAPHAFAALDLIRGRRPLAVHFHGPWTIESLINGTHPLRLPLLGVEEVAVYHTAARVIALFESYGNILERVYRVPRERIRIVPGGVDLDRFAPRESRAVARSMLGLPSDRPIVMTVGRLVRVKGLPSFVALLDRVRRAIPEVLLLIVGNGPLEPMLRRSVERRDLDRNVRFMGHVGEELPSLYRAADVVLSAAVGNDGFGLVVAEANACGTPVVLVPLGRLPKNAHPALTFPCNASDAGLADVLIEVFGGRRQLPDESVCTAFAENFGWPRIAARVRAVYEETFR